VKKLATFCLFLVVCLPAVAVEESQVMYVGGTAPGVETGAIGRFDFVPPTALIFEHKGGKLAIPYADIQSYKYSSEVTRHLGVLPAVAVGVIKMRRHSHFVRISYRGADNSEQAVIFEVPKHLPRTLQAVLETRAPGASKHCPWRGKELAQCIRFQLAL